MSNHRHASRTALAPLLLVASLFASAAQASDVPPSGSTSGASLLDTLTHTSLTRPPFAAGPTDYLAQAAGAIAPMSHALASSSSLFVQSAAALRNPLSSSLRSDADLALWNLVATVRAQQANQPFELVDTGVSAFQVYATPVVPSPVPLPGAVWLFVMGTLGLAGTRAGAVTSALGAAIGRWRLRGVQSLPQGAAMVA